MAFPFLPFGAVLAASVLLAALSVFGLILRAMDRAILGLRDTAVSGLVAGLRTWTTARPEHLATTSPGATSSDASRAADSVPLASASTMAIVRPAAAPTERASVPFPPAEVIDLDSSPIEPAPLGRR
jgi:hypothetical protein